MDTLPAELLTGPFTVARALELGVSRKALRGKRFRAPFAGVPDTLRSRCAAASLLLPDDAAFSHETAAVLRSLPLPFGADLGRLQVSVPAGRGLPRLAGVQGHRVEWDSSDVGQVDGLRVTSAARTWCDLAATGWSLMDVVACADFVLRWRRERGLNELRAAADRWQGRRGARTLRRALELASLRVDSPMETRLRLLLLDAGLPPAEVNVAVRDRFGEIVHTPDLSWPRWRVAVDYDGSHHFRDDDERDVAARRRADWRRRHDISRQEDLQAEGWILRVATAYDLLHEPARLVSRVSVALREAGATF